MWISESLRETRLRILAPLPDGEDRDTQAPIWPSGALELNLSGNGQTATVNWPEAIDDGVLAGYSITVDGGR